MCRMFPWHRKKLKTHSANDWEENSNYGEQKFSNLSVLVQKITKMIGARNEPWQYVDLFLKASYGTVADTALCVRWHLRAR